MNGTILDSSFVGLSISGLAFFPASGHLFVMVNDFVEEVTVLDAYNNYAVVDSFPVDDFGLGAGAGMEADCAGNLWLVNQNTGNIYKVASGEAGTPGGCPIDIPWLSVDPTSGTVPPALGNGATNPFPISVTWDSEGILPGLYQAQLAFLSQTPAQMDPVAVTLTVRFLDVPDDNQFQAYIYGVAGAGVMFGGTPVCLPGVLYFCPDGFVTRADMAGYLWRAINGRNTPPPVYQNIFSDVTFNDYNSFYIQGIFDLGVTAGCSASPDALLSRHPGDPRTDVGPGLEGRARRRGAAGVHGRSVQRRSLPEPVRRLHRGLYSTRVWWRVAETTTTAPSSPSATVRWRSSWPRLSGSRCSCPRRRWRGKAFSASITGAAHAAPVFFCDNGPP